MIRDEDCDVEPLTTEDFDDSNSDTMKHFMIEQARLGVICEST